MKTFIQTHYIIRLTRFVLATLFLISVSACGGGGSGGSPGAGNQTDPAETVVTGRA